MEPAGDFGIDLITPDGDARFSESCASKREPTGDARQRSQNPRERQLKSSAAGYARRQVREAPAARNEE
jgi:hypothetical protein